MENFYSLKKEPRIPLFDELAEEAARSGFLHLSSELAFYGVTEAAEIRTAVEGCIRLLRNTSDDSQRHFRRTFAFTPEGVRQVWMVSREGWELLLLRIAPSSPQLSEKLLQSVKKRAFR